MLAIGARIPTKIRGSCYQELTYRDIEGQDTLVPVAGLNQNFVNIEPRFRKRADGSLNLSDTTDATKLRQAREGKPWMRTMSPEAVVDRAKKALIQHQGDPANRKHLLGFFEIQFGVYHGQTFKWVIENALGYAGTLASDTFQDHLLDGLARWNEDRAVAATTEGQQPRSYNHILCHAVNALAEEVLGKKIIPYAEPRKYTDELIGVEYLYQQTGKVLQDYKLAIEESETTDVHVELVEGYARGVSGHHCPHLRHWTYPCCIVRSISSVSDSISSNSSSSSLSSLPSDTTSSQLLTPSKPAHSFPVEQLAAEPEETSETSEESTSHDVKTRFLLKCPRTINETAPCYIARSQLNSRDLVGLRDVMAAPQRTTVAEVVGIGVRRNMQPTRCAAVSQPFRIQWKSRVRQQHSPNPPVFVH
ncbi:hypothetical protein F2P81_002422 [Scophthalmus maximus]|uniref:Uncharacterized protein n=1 Tax=Scophthalmus maximus TaxID=52904 RepID=A0A6A4TIQ7_SCOMX|nr:hypothetical protein F2P81_002422 [Scophthalmus maximus]